MRPPPPRQTGDDEPNLCGPWGRHGAESMDEPSPDAIEATGDSEDDNSAASTATVERVGKCDGDGDDAESCCGARDDDNGDGGDDEEKEEQEEQEEDVDDDDEEEEAVCWRTWLAERAPACQPAPGEDGGGRPDGNEVGGEAVDEEISEENRRFWEACLANEYPTHPRN